MLRTDETRYAFVNGAVTDKYIYLLYSGKLNSGIHPEYGKYIYQYDWSGDPIKKWVLDREILSLGLSHDDKTLYAYDPNNGNILQTLINN